MTSRSYPVIDRSTALIPYNSVPLHMFLRSCLENATDKAARRSFGVARADYQNLSRSWNGSVVVLVGGSSAGKSTIITALKRQDQNMVEEGSDLTGANFVYAFMETHHERFGVTKKDWEFLHTVLIPRDGNWHIHEAVSGGNGDFLYDTPEEARERAMKIATALREPVDAFVTHLDAGMDMDHVVMDATARHVQSGRNVAFDILDLDKVKEHVISRCAHIKTVLVYCPFDKLTERLAERNRKAFAGETGLHEVRAGVFPLVQYAKLVRPKQASDCDENVIDQVTRKNVEDHFDVNFDAGIDALKRTPEGRAKLDEVGRKKGGWTAKRAREKQELLKAFGFTASDAPNRCIELVPREQYDLRIDTSALVLGTTPFERANTSARRILESNPVRSVLAIHPTHTTEEMALRRANYHQASQYLSSLTREELAALLSTAQSLCSHTGGETLLVEVAGVPIFVKKIRLTAVEEQNPRSTANLFGLPTYYQYGVGSLGFGAWRELAAHEMTTKWVLNGECHNFPLMYHARVLPRSAPQLVPTEQQLKDREQYIADWDGSQAVGMRMEELDRSSSDIVLFMERFSQPLDSWLRVDGNVFDRAKIRNLERELCSVVAFMKSRGFLHLDAHSDNIMTNNHHVYLADFGLAMSQSFDLAAEERRFLAQHRGYDRCYIITKLAEAMIAGSQNAIAAEINGEGIHIFPEDFPPRTITIGVPPAIRSIAVLMNSFFHALKKVSKSTPYPQVELASHL